MKASLLTQEALKALPERLPQWRLSADGLSISRTFVFADFAQAFAFMTRMAEVSERLQRLTPRELEICQWMVRGYSNQQIAAIDGGASATIKLHLARVMDKMGADTLPELIDMLVGIDLPSPQRQL